MKSNPYVTQVKETGSRNNFEKTVIRTLEQLTNSFVSNIDVSFKQPAETSEYDIILFVSDNLVFLIEVKDYQKTQDYIRKQKQTSNFKETLKSTLILKTLDKASRLSEHVEIIIILKDFPPEKFSEINKIASSRGIILWDSEDLKNRLKRMLDISIQNLSHNSSKTLNDFSKY